MQFDGTGYDERLFRLMLAEYARRNFPASERERLPEVRVSICEPFDWHDPESDSYDNQSIIVIPANVPPRPHGPGLLGGEPVTGRPQPPPRPERQAQVSPPPAPDAAEPPAPEPDEPPDEPAEESEPEDNEASHEGCYVWECYTAIADFSVGYLVTEAGNIDRPLVFFEASGDDTSPDFDSPAAIKAVWRIADNLDRASRVNCIDLRDKGRPDSVSPMPDFIYSLRCLRIDRDGNGIPEVTARTPQPFCRFKLERMQKLAR